MKIYLSSPYLRNINWEAKCSGCNCSVIGHPYQQSLPSKTITNHHYKNIHICIFWSVTTMVTVWLGLGKNHFSSWFGNYVHGEKKSTLIVARKQEANSSLTCQRHNICRPIHPPTLPSSLQMMYLYFTQTLEVLFVSWTHTYASNILLTKVIQIFFVNLLWKQFPF